MAAMFLATLALAVIYARLYRGGDGIAEGALFGALIGVFALGLTILGGAVFPVAVLPAWLRSISVVVPSRPAFDGVRQALFKGGDSWLGSATELVLLSCLVMALAIHLFDRSLATARRRGTLASL